MDKRIVVGIDGGGTYTRVVIADLEGNILAFSKKAGSHPGKNKEPEKNVESAIMEALGKANYTLESIQCIVAGFAGLNGPKDMEWAEKYLSITGLKSSKVILNDAEVAHYGAFLGKVGILAIAGTGSIVVGKIESGKMIRNYDFHHDSEAASRFLTYSVIYDLISQKSLLREESLVESVLNYWNVKDIEELRQLAARGFNSEKIRALKMLSGMGSIVTEEASKGSEIANNACEKVVTSLVTGIQLVSSMFVKDSVSLSFVGGVVNHSYVLSMVERVLKGSNSLKTFSIQKPNLSPVLGAVLYAYNELGLSNNQDILEKLISTESTNDFY
ncbi:BadF/BadG/BcrA/BcrD ATPase family protein [Peribacillus acanthi]|uniref:BadF/BadG/BcrA/BcrD ATPase family protein n=1 Tax=Peribacillus acanthi TaxID=2171554 RepID=UPI0013003EB7|nr:BadF/BadG/BcrA/BcrD ATPase family protein [Peribacillus acanthi]